MNDSKGKDRSCDSLAVPVVALVVSSREPASWEQHLVSRIKASGLCETLIWVTTPNHDDGASLCSVGIVTLPEARIVTAIVDLTGRMDVGWHRYAIEGVWHLCDERGIVLGEPWHGVATITSGAGMRLNLVANTGATGTLVGWASAYAEPSENASPQRLIPFAESLLLTALREIKVLGALEQRPDWKPRGTSLLPMQSRLYEARGWLNKVVRRARQILLVEQWMVGIVEMPFTEALRTERLPVQWLDKRAKSYYLADPFGVPGSTDEIYCEEYDASRGNGIIVKVKLDGLAVQGRREPVDLSLAGHLSYPFLFKHEGAMYCVAESAQSRRCVLNRRDENGQWAQVAVLLYDVAAADPTIFEHGGYFWLAYTDVDKGAFDNLCLCYASDLHGPWLAHPQNPVKIDHGSARSAGSVVMDGDELLRVGQVCATGYGQAIAVNRILHCTPDFYREEVVRVLSPKGDPTNPHGLHTLSAWGDRTLVDGKRYGINMTVLGRKCGARIGQLRRAFNLPKAHVQDD